jgi:uncharacterized protein (TIGR02996 family)
LTYSEGGHGCRGYSTSCGARCAAYRRRCSAAGRLWGNQAIELWQLHAADGIAADGTPTGIEHAFVSVFGVVAIRAWWTDRAGARRFRDVANDRAVAIALTRPFTTRRDRERLATVDLDALYALCREAPPSELAARIESIPLHITPLLAAPWTHYDDSRWAEPVPPRVVGDPERRLIAGIEATPGDAGAAAVYADWLEQAGRLDEAAALRA